MAKPDWEWLRVSDVTLRETEETVQRSQANLSQTEGLPNAVHSWEEHMASMPLGFCLGLIFSTWCFLVNMATVYLRGLLFGVSDKICTLET